MSRNVFPRQWDVSGIALPGGKRTVKDAIACEADIGSLLWERGQNPLPAPAELTSTRPLIAVVVKMVLHWDSGRTHPYRAQVPLHEEWVSGEVRFKSTYPRGISKGPMGAVASRVNRARVLATEGMAKARLSCPSGMCTAELPVSFAGPIHANPVYNNMPRVVSDPDDDCEDPDDECEEYT